LGKFFNVEIGASFIAAILTIAGYSVNDTIVVLDRVRENLTREKGDFEEAVEKSVHQTIARSLNTTLTTLLAMVAVYFFGGETVKYFALALIVGIACGAYSSIFIASPLLVTWYKRQYK
jgi:preprotein translocase subunit SecF